MRFYCDNAIWQITPKLPMAYNNSYLFLACWFARMIVGRGRSYWLGCTQDFMGGSGLPHKSSFWDTDCRHHGGLGHDFLIVEIPRTREIRENLWWLLRYCLWTGMCHISGHIRFAKSSHVTKAKRSEMRKMCPAQWGCWMVSLKCICWCPNCQYLVMRLYLEIRFL